MPFVVVVIGGSVEPGVDVPVWTATRCRLLERNIVLPTRRTTVPRIWAVRARPVTVTWPPESATREPIEAEPETARTTPAGDATRRAPRCFATTTPWKVAALEAAGQIPMTAAAAQMRVRRFMWFCPPGTGAGKARFPGKR